jgi:hypothetical protein
VLSIELLFTTIISAAGYVWDSTEFIALPMQALELKAGIITETLIGFFI